MRRNLLIFTLAFFAISLKAQILSEDFNSGSIPANFTTYDLDGSIIDPFLSSFMPTTASFVNVNYMGAIFAGSPSLFTPPGTADDWMITPAISLTNNSLPKTLLFDVCSGDATVLDGIEIYVSTTGNTPTDFLATTALYNSTGIGEPYMGQGWATREIDITAYSGQTISIAFRNNTYNGLVLGVDNIKVLETACVVDQYRIRYRETGTSSWSTKTMSGPVGSCNFASQKTDKLILNLTANTNYEYQMKAWYCGGGASSWSGIETFTTLDNCPNVGNLSVYGATPTKATFTWDASNGVYSFVRLKARVDSISNPTGADFFQIGGAGVAYGTYTKNKNGLTPGETYRGQARTYCDPNGGGWKSLSWTPLVYWTQPTQRIEGGEAISHLDVYPNP
ncbi:MAG: hypothetical protein CMD28_05995, partial [Flavobacteriales bacterium]|nr:hypothetical protein [Flavobacteriales bacterium]